MGVLRTIAADQPTLTSQTSASQRRSVTGAVSDSKTTGTVIPLQLRSPGESLHDMANAMLNLGYAQPRSRVNLDDIAVLNKQAQTVALP